MNTLSVFCPSTGGHESAVQNWKEKMALPWPIVVDATMQGEAAGYLQKVESFRHKTTAEVIAYFHSDLFIHCQGWDEMVLREFEDPNVAIVSFCGARTHGSRDIYQVPYDYRQLIRGGFMSNMTDAEAHGARVLEARDVAVVDSFSVIVRRSFLEEIGGWPADKYPPSHGSDYWLCLMAHRHHKRIRYLPVNCSHAGGGTKGDGSFKYPEWIATTKWKSDANCHQISHFLLYHEFRDVLPVRIG